MTAKKMTLRDVFELIQVCIQLKPQVTDTDMRGMVTHLFPRTLHPYTRFTGVVSESAAQALENMKGSYQGHRVIREHPHRIQAQLTQLVKRMRETGEWNFELFEESIKNWSAINITTTKENSMLRKKGATYESLGITLVHWDTLSPDVRHLIKKSILCKGIVNRHDWSMDMSIVPVVNDEKEESLLTDSVGIEIHENEQCQS